MIYCIWYPSGGYGHYINGILSLYGQDFKKPRSNTFEFSKNGNSHALDLVAPKYYHDPAEYQWEFSPDINYTVLIDNGINSQSTKFLEIFPGCKVIRLFYDDRSWPVVAQTTISKAMGIPMSKEIFPEANKWPEPNADWAVREKNFLYLRDSSLRQEWSPISDYMNINIGDIYEYQTLKKRLEPISPKIHDFSNVHRQWQKSNLKYFYPILLADKILKDVEQNVSHDLSSVKDLWTQAVVNYFIWIKYQIEVPANTYANWFSNTREINDLLQQF